MIKVLLTSFVLASSVFANQLVCAGQICSSSPYPGASGCTQLIVNADLDKEVVAFKTKSQSRIENKEFTLVDLNSDKESGEFIIEGESSSADLKAKLNVYGKTQPTIKVKISGQKQIKFKCLKNLIVDLK